MRRRVRVGGVGHIAVVLGAGAVALGGGTAVWAAALPAGAAGSTAVASPAEPVALAAHPAVEAVPAAVEAFTAKLRIPATHPPESSPLVDAARNGDLDALRDLVRRGADVNAAAGDGMTALHWTAHLNHTNAAEILLFAGARLEPRTRLGGYTPLLVAARVGGAEVMELLLEAGADPHARTTPGGTTALHFAAQAGSARAIELLLRHGAGIDDVDAHWGHTPLMFAAATGRLDAVRALVAAGAEVARTNRALDMTERSEEDQGLRQIRNRQIAFAREMEEATRVALGEAPEEEDAGEEAADDAEEESAEDEEAEEGEEPEAGADAEKAEEEEVEEAARAEEPEEAPDRAHTPDVDPELATDPGAIAAERAEEERTEEMLPLSYAELVGGYGGFTALHLAAREGHVEIVRELLAAGADLNGVSEGDHTSVLLIATVNGHWDLAMELLERGADPNLASDAGVAPLYAVLNLQWAPRALHPQPRAHVRQEVEYLEAMERLLEAGADPNQRLTRHLWYKSYNFDLLGVDTWGASPFWRAAYATDVRAMRLLLEHGADPTTPTRRPAERRRGGSDDGSEEDASGLPPVPTGGPSVTPLHAASGVGYGEGFAANAHRHVPGGWLPAVRLLVEELGLDVDARDHNGFTPLHHAAARGDVDLIRYLVDRGADVRAVSRSGLTTADMANGPAQRVPPYPRAIALLRELGSDFNDRCLSC